MRLYFWLGLLGALPCSCFAIKGYVTNSGNNTVSIVDLDLNKVIGTIAVGETPLGAAINGNRLYVSDANEDAVSVVDIINNEEIKKISINGSSGYNPFYLGIYGRYLYVSVFGGGSLH